MGRNRVLHTGLIFFLIMAGLASPARLTAQKDSVSINWEIRQFTSKTTPTLQVVEMPGLRFPAAVHDNLFKALKDLGADYVRYVPWFPYPKLAVAELKRPTRDSVFWDFTYLDSTMKSFMEATQGHSVVINFSTTPAWMWKTDWTVYYPDDPYQPFWDYNQGARMRDTTMKELADYYGRVFSWYTRGGFTDELGKFHKSGLHYKIPYWEVLNEPDLEHNISPRVYTKMYDAIVGKLKKISPGTKFIGITVAFNNDPEWFDYFLNPKNHQPGIPLDAISYHHYSTPSVSGQTIDQWQYTFYEKANDFLHKVAYIENIRKRLSPKTITTINEIGTIVNENPTKEYFCLSGACFAYIYLELTKMGIEVAGSSQLLGIPGMFPDVSMTNWENGKPNARFWVLKLIKDHLGPGDQLVETQQKGAGFISQAFATARGRKLLLINKYNRETQITLPVETQNAFAEVVDVSTGELPPVRQKLKTNTITLKPFAVAVLQW
jgi:hypothetical protein